MSQRVAFWLGQHLNADITIFLDIDWGSIKPCPGCGHSPRPNEIDDFIYPSNRTRTVWTANCTHGGSNHCGWNVIGSDPGEVLRKWNTRSESLKDLSHKCVGTRVKTLNTKRNLKQSTLNQTKPHVCERNRTCLCDIQALAPNECCPIHGYGEWPPRCGTCGRYMKRSSK